MHAIYSVISLALIGFIVFFLFNQYRIDRLRSRLFELRDSLFLDAVAGKISFDSPGYIYTRTVLNGMMRFGHRVSISRVVMAIFLIDADEAAEAREKQRQAMSACSKAEAELCRSYLEGANVTIVRHLTTSPYSFALLIPIVSSILMLVHFNAAVQAVKKWSQWFIRLDQAAYREGLSVRSDRLSSAGPVTV